MDAYAIDAKNILSDGIAPCTTNSIAYVGFLPCVLDLGGGLGGTMPRADIGVIGNLASVHFAVVIDITAMVVATNDDIYSIDIMGSNSPNRLWQQQKLRTFEPGNVSHVRF